MSGGKGNFFQDVLSDPAGVENKLLGPSYPYYKNIKSPSEIGMSDKGTLPQMGRNIDGLIQYVEVLVTGKSKASKTGRPLGNKFFLQTGAKCAALDTCSDKKDTSTCQQVDRYIYINNVPEGNIPIISSGLGVNFSDFKGLIPGTISNLNALNPYGIMRAFMSGSTPPCQNLTMQTIDINNNRSSESHYVTLADIASIDPCSFTDKKNPVSGERCRNAFQTMSGGVAANAQEVVMMSDDPLAQAYIGGLTALGIYILYRLMQKSA